jgi:hypothetical protein
VVDSPFCFKLSLFFFLDLRFYSLMRAASVLQTHRTSTLPQIHDLLCPVCDCSKARVATPCPVTLSVTARVARELLPTISLLASIWKLPTTGSLGMEDKPTMGKLAGHSLYESEDFRQSRANLPYVKVDGAYLTFLTSRVQVFLARHVAVAAAESPRGCLYSNLLLPPSLQRAGCAYQESASSGSGAR